MKTKILSICSFFFLLNVSAQENVIHESGNVGIGTTNPEAKLDVKGKVNIDSTLVVKDSVTIEKRI